MYLLKKLIKIIAVLLIFNSLLLTQTTQGSFGVTVGDKVKYRIKKSNIKVEFASLEEDFSGFIVSEYIADVGTSFRLEVAEITSTELNWKASIGGSPIQGNCPLTLTESDFVEIAIPNDFTYLYNLEAINSAGEIDIHHLLPVMVSPFLNVVPVTWETFEYFVENQSDLLAYAYYNVTDFDSTINFSNDIMTLWWYFDSNTEVDSQTEYYLTNDLTVIYNTLTGVLQEAKIVTQFSGTHQDNEFNITSNYHILQANFVEFLDEYKWYLVAIGGVVMITIVVIVVIIVKKRR